MGTASDSAAAAAEAPRAAAPAEESSPLLRLLPHLLQVLRREPAVAITLSYLLVALAGIYYSHSFYAQFDIPVLNLAQVSDFLVAGIQQPVALMLLLSTFLLCWVFDRGGMAYRRFLLAQRARLQERTSATFWRRYRLRIIDSQIGKDWHEQGTYLIVVLLYGWLFIGFFADYKVAAIKRGDAPVVRIWPAGEQAGFPGGQAQSWTWLGAVSNYVFVYDPASARSMILPVQAIARIEPLPRPKKVAKVAAPKP